MLKDKGILKALWVGMYILCVVMSFLPSPSAGTKVLLMLFAALFFVPPFADVYFSWKRKDQQELRLVRNLCLASLGATLVALVANVLSVLGYETLGNVLYYVLVMVSVPMICGQYWVYSLLLWAILLWCAIAALGKRKKS